MRQLHRSRPLLTALMLVASVVAWLVPTPAQAGAQGAISPGSTSRSANVPAANVPAANVPAVNVPGANVPGARKSTFTAQVWADNWFALYVNGRKVGEDSVPITTERSFNAETITFTAAYPLTIGIMGKDYMENASGLEYIGTNRQQMGDGGLIAQIRDDSTGRIIVVTDASWKALVLQAAPLNPACVTSGNPLVDCMASTTAAPANWAAATTSVTSWPNATVYTAQQVRPKEGYDTIRWDRAARLIWSSDLVRDNTILFRTTVRA